MESCFSFEASIDLRPMQRFVDGLEDVIHACENVLVPEAHHSIAIRPEKGVASGIVARLLDLLVAIQLDDETRLDTREIADVWADRVLSPKFSSTELPPP
jgi:hypothetical protein